MEEAEETPDSFGEKVKIKEGSYNEVEADEAIYNYDGSVPPINVWIKFQCGN
ncbi:hypothetical protein J1N35_028071 [Gossypium stocksii]|uniref:Uncharacterized protein n=1 Tax=Gossypium stocksii TaxID=47602 RepID=A0A9D3ZRL8_9ROSI|nr:hypothetical protein J1N35_028071 [Gossypium stocksii]